MKSYADMIIDRHWDGYIPVNIEDIVRKEGIFLESIPDRDAYQYSGMASIDSYGRKAISISPNIHHNRRRFTIAHELGHHVLQHVTPEFPRHRDNDYSFSGNNADWMEVEANQFAAEVLMPDTAIDYMIKREGVTDISDLARAFEVSEQAMYYRMLNLGYIR